MNIGHLRGIISQKTPSAAADAIYDFYDDQFFKGGRESLTELGITVISVGSFFGQIRDGGIRTYLESPWKDFIKDVVPSLKKMRLDTYAEIVTEILKKINSIDLDDRAITDELEQPFWDYFWRSGDRDSLAIDHALVDYWKNNSNNP